MRKDSWDLGTWGRIPVQLHWTVLLSAAWLYIIFQDLLATLIGAVALVPLMLAHEYGHVLALRRRKIAISGISLYGVHGETSYNEYATKGNDTIVVAWAGVGAQVVVLLLALVVTAVVPFHSIPYGDIVWGPMYFVFTKFNIFLMIVALLPIGPFDGHAAWQVIPRMRKKMKAKAKPRVAPKAPPAEDITRISPEKQQEMDVEAEKETASLIARLTGKSDSTEDRR
jgi:Zn-dependent protease